MFPIEKSFHTHPKAQFWSNKNNTKPECIRISSIKKRWFDCDKCHHSFEKSLHHILKDSWCPYCSNQKLCNDKDCDDCFNKSFASNIKNIFWNKTNKSIPRQVFKSSQKKYLFDCNICNHTFEKRLCHISQNSWCPYCCKNSIMLCKNNECKICFQKSFASNKKSQFWSDKNILSPRQVFNRSKNKFYFNCDKCQHTYKTSLDCIKSWCQYCSNRKLCEDNECKICFQKSFASNEKS